MAARRFQSGPLAFNLTMCFSIPFINFCSGSASIGIEGEIEEVVY
jgi:hypothetical protein